MQNITLTLSIDEVNKILEALGHLPYMQVHEIIHKIHAQAAQQFDSKKESND